MHGLDERADTCFIDKEILDDKEKCDAEEDRDEDCRNKEVEEEG